MAIEQECARCENTINPNGEPIENTGKYVKADDLTQERERSVIKAVKLTEAGKQLRDRAREEEDLNTAQANRAVARNDQDYLPEQVDEQKHLRKEEVPAPVTPEQDPDVVKTVEETETVELNNPDLICKDCVKDSDEVIW